MLATLYTVVSFRYHCSSDTFVTCDMTGTNYLCLHLSASNQLWLLTLSRYNCQYVCMYYQIYISLSNTHICSQGDTVDVGPITTVHNVYQVLNLSVLKMMLILTVNGDIVLYSGDRKVITVQYYAIILLILL